MTTKNSVKLTDILISKNIRDTTDDTGIKELAAPVEVHGLLQPVGVMPINKKMGLKTYKYELVYGHRRYAAFKLLGRPTIPVTVLVKKIPEKFRLAMKFVENHMRVDLSPLEEAAVLSRLTKEFGMKSSQIAETLGKTPGYVSQRLKLLQLTDPVKEALVNNQITPTHARELARVKDERQQTKLLRKAQKMDAAEFKEVVAEALPAPGDKPKRGRRPKSEAVDKGAGTRGKHKEHDRAYAAPAVVTESAVRKGAQDTQAIIEAINAADARMKKAETAKQESKVAYFRGMIRGIAWTSKMGNVKKLF